MPGRNIVRPSGKRGIDPVTGRRILSTGNPCICCDEGGGGPLPCANCPDQPFNPTRAVVVFSGVQIQDYSCADCVSERGEWVFNPNSSFILNRDEFTTTSCSYSLLNIPGFRRWVCHNGQFIGQTWVDIRLRLFLSLSPPGYGCQISMQHFGIGEYLFRSADYTSGCALDNQPYFEDRPTLNNGICGYYHINAGAFATVDLLT